MKTETSPKAEPAEFSHRRWSITREGRLVSLDVDVFHIAEVNACWIARLFTPVPIRRKGYGREAMEALCAAADKEGVRLVLSINAYGGMSKAALKKFYQSLGFSRKSELCQELCDDGLMVREAR